MNRDDVFYEALRSRDHRFDGKFFVGVKTTGIYCRPICPAKPKRQNVEFFLSRELAEKAGYRPCLRCRPESAPQSPAWIGKSAVVNRAIKTLNSDAALKFNEDRFAESFGMSARHLRRLFMTEIGKTPKQLAFENRLGFARKLIVETKFPIADIAYASGFNSIRRFNSAFKERFKRTPGKIRRSPLAKSAMRISLAYRPPFDFAGLLKIYRSHQTGNLEWFDDESMHRVIEHEGVLGEIAIRNDADNSRILVDIDFADPSYLNTLIHKVRALFDLDADPVVIANSLESNSQVKKLLKKHPGIRIPSGWDPFEISIAAILGQLVSVERGRALVADLIEEHGKELKGVKLFPTPQAIADADLTNLKTTKIRKRTLKLFSQAVASGEVNLDPAQDVDQFMKSVLAISGIGPWTASYMALKVLRHTDAFPHTDLILARALDIHSREVVDSFSPWRGYAAALFWREYTHKLKRTKNAAV